MEKYVVIEMQNGNVGSNSWAYDTRADAEVKFYAALSEIVKSPIDLHTIMLVTGAGMVLECKSYVHPAGGE